MTTNVDLELWMPTFFVNLAVGRALVTKGVLTPSDIRDELLKMSSAKSVDPAIAKAVEEAALAVSTW